MRYALMTEPQQGYSYGDILAAANAAKAAGFETYFRSDHYSSFPGERGLSASDCWTTLAGLARETSGIGLGSMVSPVTFRIPGSFAKVVATVDEMAGPGRIEMGVGAGWNEEEHAALGIPYPGTFILDRSGVIRAKLFHEGYKERHVSEQILEAAKTIAPR